MTKFGARRIRGKTILRPENEPSPGWREAYPAPGDATIHDIAANGVFG
jgi:hypothetical protein